MSLNRKLVVTIAVFSLAALAFAPARAANTGINSVDWTYQPSSNGANFWLACVAMKSGSGAGLSYSFVHSAYSQSGTLSTNGCFTVYQTAVGLTFSYGSPYSLSAGNSKVQSFTVTTAATLGGTIVPTSASVMVLAWIVGGVAAAALAVGVGLYASRQKHLLVSA